MPIERRLLGRTGMNVSVVGFGGSETGYGGTAPKVLATILGQAMDNGLNMIDTAACYGDGEAQLGRALAGRRKDVYLMTKCGHATGFLGRDWDPKTIARSIDRSLKLLRTDYVDLMQLHSCDAATLRDDRVLGVLIKARDAGKVRYIGYSGDSDDAQCAVESGVFDTLQISVSIADQEAIERILPEAAKRQIGVIAKRPLANAAWRADSSDGYSAPYRERLKKLNYEFLSTPDAAAIALRFTLSVPGVATAIVGTTKPGRWEQNAAAAAAGALSAAEYDSIRARWRSVADASWVGER